MAWRCGLTQLPQAATSSRATTRECGLTADECVLLARNSLEATFAAPEEKAALVAKLRAYCEGFSA